MPKRGGKKKDRQPSIHDLSRKPLTEASESEAEAYFNELMTANDRTAALIAGAALDGAMVELLRRHFIVELEPEDFVATFYGQNAMLGSFANRTRLCYLVGLISARMRKDLDTIRHVRNAFAHTVTPLSFSHPLVTAECANLTLRDPIEDLTQPISDARLRFVLAAKGIYVSFLRLMRKQIDRNLDELSEHKILARLLSPELHDEPLP